jgi:hypothetical protein
VWTGIEFKKPGRFASSWIERLRAADLTPEENEEGSGLVAYVGVFQELSEAIGEASDGGAQAAAITRWLVEKTERLVDAGGVGSNTATGC